MTHNQRALSLDRNGIIHFGCGYVFKKNQNMPSGAIAANDLLKVTEFIA